LGKDARSSMKSLAQGSNADATGDQLPSSLGRARTPRRASRGTHAFSTRAGPTVGVLQDSPPEILSPRTHDEEPPTASTPIASRIAAGLHWRGLSPLRGQAVECGPARRMTVCYYAPCRIRITIQRGIDPWRIESVKMSRGWSAAATTAGGTRSQFDRP